jgi:hypothetical protein
VGTPVEASGALTMAGGTGAKTLVITCSGIPSEFCAARLLTGETFSTAVELPFRYGAQLTYSEAEGIWLAWESPRWKLVGGTGIEPATTGW